ncbi:hypothetical protein GQ42DRAFT_38635 [Ramicandelaber brevisporus]|nr:hypothetical protein GQ42DRAFT_38635 [Ramicandelaber brevisporus]
MQPPPRYTRVSTAEVESQFQSTEVSPAATPITTTFYADIRADPDASQDEILEAAVRRFTELMGESRYQEHLNTLFVAFSTLYDPEKRAAYDRYGDALFEKLDISSGASTGHPTLYERQCHHVLAVLQIFPLCMYVPMLFGALIGGAIGRNPFATAFQVGVTILPFAFVLCYYSNLMVLKTAISTIWTMLFDSRSQIATAAHDEQQPRTISSRNSTLASQSQLIRAFGFKQLLNQLPGVATYALCMFTSIFIPLTFYIHGSIGESLGKFSKYGMLIIFSIILFSTSSNLTRIVRNKGLVQPHLVILFETMRNRATPSGYRPETYMSKLQDSFGKAMLNMESPLVVWTACLLAALNGIPYYMLVYIKSSAIGVVGVVFWTSLIFFCSLFMVLIFMWIIATSIERQYSNFL